MKQKYQYFIASRWRNRDSVLELAKKLRQKGKVVYCFMETDKFHSFAADPEETMQQFEATPDWKNSTMIQQIFKKDMDALKASETIVLLLPAGKSAHIEAGVGYGLGKKLVVIAQQKEAESLYMIFNEHYQTVDDFIYHL